MSAEELRIRRELEMEVEKELAAEIKDEICNLSLRLLQLYEQQKEREGREFSRLVKKNSENKTLSEVKINIIMKEGTKVEPKESTKGVGKGDKPKIRSEVVTNVPENATNVLKNSNLSKKNTRKGITDSRKKFDWVKTLRSSNVDFDSKNVVKKTAKMWDDTVQVAGVRKNCMTQGK